jgi:hypothetical protein
MANEGLVFDGHSAADEGVARNLAALADARALLDLNKRSNSGFVPDLATVKVDETKQPDAGA